MRSPTLSRAAIVVLGVIYPAVFAAQSIPLEGMVGQRNALYQHTIYSPIDSGAWFFFHTSSVHAYFDPELRDEQMSQSYIGWRMNKWLAFSAGAFYASVPGFSPSIHAQLQYRGDRGFIVAVPRIDLTARPAYDIMVLAEYHGHLSARWSWIARWQSMFNYTGQRHNRSYQNVRLGVERNDWQFGLAANRDAYGPQLSDFYNVGMFIRRSISLR